MTEEKQYKLDQVSVRLKLCEESPLYSAEAINTPRKAVEVMKDLLRQLDRENVMVLSIDNAGRAINYTVSSIGNINASIVSLREILKVPLLSNASHIILMHNHPSYRTEKPVPSREDNISTLNVMLGAGFMGIPLADHIIVSGGTGSIYSYKMELKEDFSIEGLQKIVGEDIGLDILNEIQAAYKAEISKITDFGPKRVIEPEKEERPEDPEKSAEYKPLAKVEELEEQNYNQIDNVLNNAKPKKAERPEDRPSLRERLRSGRMKMEAEKRERNLQDPRHKTEKVI